MSILHHTLGIDLSKLPFMNSILLQKTGKWLSVTRCGYTGEDGFEISLDNADAKDFADSLLNHPQVKPAGLLARDSLRLEAGLCLHGSDIDDNTTPAEAGLTFTIGKGRKEARDFPGADRVIGRTPQTRRVGVVVNGGHSIPRGGSILLHPDSNSTIGKITSGGWSPILDAPIAMATVGKEMAKVGTKLLVQIRGQSCPATVTRLPFVPFTFFKPN
eukprot:GHVO01015732.1.p1 GENE.GHVO01015732.1~~GHVO01015732.1.p1  ORF type:complete len:216 (+),score=30.76 GHVO01015732.1:379-1026(+)